MKKLLIPIALAALSCMAVADPVADLQAGTDGVFKVISASYSATSASLGNAAGVLPEGNVVKMTKPAGSLNATVSMSQMYPVLGLNTNLNLAGTNKGSGKLQFAVTAPTLIGQTVTLYLGTPTAPKIYQVKVTGFTGQFNVVASRLLKPLSVDAAYRNTGFISDPAVPSSFTLTGTANSQAFTLNVTSVVDGGIGGQVVSNFVKLVEIIPQVYKYSIQGGMTATGKVTLAKPAATGGMSVAISYLNAPAASGPASVTVPAGQTSATFTITTTTVTEAQALFVQTVANTYQDRSSLMSIVPLVIYMTLSGSSTDGGGTYPGGKSVVATLRLVTPAATTISGKLFSTHPDITFSASTISIPPGGLTKSFTIKTPVVQQALNAEIWALGDNNSPTNKWWVPGFIYLMPVSYKK